MKIALAVGLVAAMGVASAAAAPGPITVDRAWFRYLLPQIPAAGFVSLHNHGDTPAILTGVRTASCGSAMLHRSVDRSGVDRMVMLGSITVPAHGVVRLATGGDHIMCMQPRMRPGGKVPVTLIFASMPPVTVRFAVYGADGEPASR